jgi:hypothetical protein
MTISNDKPTIPTAFVELLTVAAFEEDRLMNEQRNSRVRHIQDDKQQRTNDPNSIRGTTDGRRIRGG